MKAIILAAGMGKRLKQYTENNTKCMVSVGKQTLIERMLKQLDKYDLSSIIIVVGYKKDNLIDHVSGLNIKTPIEFVSNDIYDRTNNIYSLSLVKDRLIQSDTILLESDIIFEDAVLDAAINSNNDSLMLVDKYESWMDGTCITLDANSKISSFVNKNNFDFKKANEYYKTVNIYKFSKKFSADKYVPYLDIYLKEYGDNIYYEEVLNAISMLKNPGITAKCIRGGMKWYEIDDEQDLDIAKSMFSQRDDSLNEYNYRYGGYWRFPAILDFCYLVNPYYPTKKLLDEIRTKSNDLVTKYPSGREVISKIAANSFNISDEQILVGNGAAELINLLTHQLKGSIGIITPTFEEYRNRIDEKRIVYLDTETLDFKYDHQTIIKYFSENKVDNIVLINPDNPSGNYIGISGLMKLLEWTKENNIRLIIDESFVDFTADGEGSLFDSKIINKYSNLVLIKSISKSHGVPGTRLGILASSDKNLISKIGEETSIWNVNSFGEYYLQIMNKYSSDFADSMGLFRIERERFYKELIKIKKLNVYRSEANYFMIEILNGISSKELSIKLLNDFNIYIKDLSSKIKARNCIRVAIRNEEDNDRLVKALKEILG